MKKQVMMRVDPAAWSAIKLLAHDSGMGLAEYVVDCALRSKRPIGPEAQERLRASIESMDIQLRRLQRLCDG